MTHLPNGKRVSHFWLIRADKVTQQPYLKLTYIQADPESPMEPTTFRDVKERIEAGQVAGKSPMLIISYVGLN